MTRLMCGVILSGAMLFSAPSFAQNNELLVKNEIDDKGVRPQQDELKAPAISAAGPDGDIKDSVISKIRTLIRKPAVTPRSFIVPSAMVVAGISVALSKDLGAANTFAKKELYRNGNELHLKYDNYTMLAPAAAVYALNAAGIKGEHNLLDRSMILVMSGTICNGIVFATKRYSGVCRPDNSDYYSFPSGHTAMAFATAEFMRQEYRGVSAWYGAAGYACAIGTGMLRMYHDKHWLSDVVTGAGVGILSTRASYWLYPKIKKALFPGAGTGNAMIAPTYSNGAYGLSMVYRF